MAMGAQLSEEKPYTSQRLTRVSLLANSIGSPGWRNVAKTRTKKRKNNNKSEITQLYKNYTQNIKLYTSNTKVLHHRAEVCGAPVVDALNGGAG